MDPPHRRRRLGHGARGRRWRIFNRRHYVGMVGIAGVAEARRQDRLDIGERGLGSRRKAARRELTRGLDFVAGALRPYWEILRSDSSVPICWNVVTIWSEEVSRKNLSEDEAQSCSSVEVGSLVVLTCTV